ncbi:MAG TPA: sialidase family protein [Ktedonobacterales bacterium]|nr:sialidase family protein [Ktedonobacterales bacterium]
MRTRASGRSSEPGVAVSRRRAPASVALLACLALIVLTACGPSATAKSDAHSAATATTYMTKGRGIPTPTATPVSPYRFPKQWQVSTALATTLFSYAFMPTSPLVGFACAPSTMAPHTSELYVTRDGGATWTLLPNAPASNPVIPFTGCEVFPDQTNANDVFVSVQDASDPRDTHGVGRLYRSQDGGATWQKLALVVPGTWYGPNTLAVSGARILVTVAPGGEQNALFNYLYASDDGGQTWNSVAPSLNGQLLLVSAEMGVMGRTVFVTSSAYQTGPTSSRPTYSQGHRLSAPGSSGTPAPTTYWRSDDGGATWRQIQLPGELPMFVLSTDGGYYAVSLKRPRDASGGYIANATITPYASSDGGATWKALPTFAGVEQGYLDPTLLGVNGGMTITPDGALIAAATHSTPTSSDDAGLFTLRLSDANPTWQPLAASQGATNLWAVTRNGQTILWGLLHNGPENGTLASMTLN